MSNPNRILGHRILPPFGRLLKTPEKGIDEKETEVLKLHFFENYLQPELSEDMVTDYLIRHPTFLESFLMDKYSTIKLMEIVNKMSNETKEVVYIPKRSELFSQKLETTTKSRHFVSQISEGAVNTLVSKDSFESIIGSSEIGANEIPLPFKASNQSPTQIEYFTFLNRSGQDDAVSDSKKQLIMEALPRLSQNYQVPRYYMSSSDDGFTKKQTTIDLLNEMKQDLISILRCDGANMYLADQVNGIIYKNVSERNVQQKIEKGTTLAAYVAYERVPVNCHDIFMDDRFPLGILMNNTFIKAVIAQPIIINTGELIGIIELYRSVEKTSFSSKDEEIFQNYCTWAGLAIFYNEINMKNEKQEKLNKFILKVTQKMFGKFKNTDSIIKEIMASAKSIVKADRVSLFLVDKDYNELYGRIFDNGTFDECIFETSENIIRFKVGEGIAGLVASTGKTLNIQDAYKDDRFNRGIDTITGYITKTILCMPVKLKKDIIGVVQMLNKRDGVFTKTDETDFETFATYCGLALHISKMYEKILRSQQKYKVALDVLSYHNGYSNDEFEKLRLQQIPTNINNLTSLSFWPWTVSHENQPLYVVFMFRDLFGLDQFDGETLMRFILTIKKNYRVVPYHNWNHAFSVAHSMYALLKTCKNDFNLYESLALFIGCLCHDLDHRGKTNEFMIQNSGPLSALYSTSTMEHHHFNMTITILQRDGHNIFGHLTAQNYKRVLSNIKHCILATDLAKYFEYRQLFESSEEYQSSLDYPSRLIHMALSMTFCDLCSMYKSWDMQLTLVMIIMQEFWTQGDEEKSKGLMPIKLMDRDYMIELPDSQVGFITYVCLPCYRIISSIMPEAGTVISEAENNLIRWTELANLSQSEKIKRLQELEYYVENVIEENKLFVRIK